MKIILVKVQETKLENLKIIIIGKIRAISTSKIKKIIVIRKNRIENGIREEFIGSNPHSNGEHFSRSFVVFFESKEAKIITIDAINITIIVIIDKFKIIYTKIFSPYDWKSYILIYYINLSTSSVNRNI
jgi:hypothetical protein